ncbi:sigma-54-dependent Fis family transcriptional regulator [Oceanospirillum beijerinckii]|uniref:sigma-54-dependent Fis family transcriptional regulator n=1 Tax=Oceanospirillum beijerinckii TaxID=64976 RepID=UPI000405695B|nr:sigma-54-dependent Fis family transcriptional regulator [Oceanospirillum beijerinckii]
MSRESQHSPQSVEFARKHLQQEGQVPRGFLRSEIAHSWQRSVDAGLTCSAPLDLENLPKDRIADLKDLHRPLLEAAHPEIKQLAEYFAPVGGLVMLADAEATILSVKGDRRHLDTPTQYALQAGASWSEELRGTNALGTAIIDQASVTINGSEHFLDSVGYLSCCSSPITNAQGEVIGVLDLPSPTDNRKLSPNMSLVQQAVRSVENRMFSSRYQQQVVLSVHSRPEYLRSSWQGMIAMELDGFIQAANEQACQLLNRKRAELLGRHLEELFGVKPEALLNDLHRKGRGVLRTRIGDFVCELLHFPNSLPFSRSRTGNSSARLSSSNSTRAKSASNAPKIEAPALSELSGDDPRLQKGIRMGSRALSHELPVLIQGETGSGKEVVAKALHLDSRRRDQAFVAVNCAAIPEGLIESELFGYQEGAFTGSRKGGMTGRLQQANGGTLFLDEIGDMPLALQARLLRVLQERTIAPLGAAEEIALDIAVICASHRDLKALVAEGLFREDLYYRLNGVCLRLPAFRERTDKHTFISTFLHQLTPDGRQISLCRELEQQLLSYHWPGNIRQLETTLRVAIAFMEPDETQINSDHLSDDFLEELASSPTVAGNSLSIPQPETIQENSIPTSNPKTNLPPIPPASHSLKDNESLMIQHTLQQHEGNISATAQALGISRATLYRKLKDIEH